MNALEVARKDFLDVRRSKVTWLVLLIYTGFAGLVMYTGIDTFRYRDAVRQTVLFNLFGLVRSGAFLVPIVALVVAYLAIAGERETGSVTFLLGLPNTRGDVVVGKFLSRGFVIVLGICGAYLVIAAFLAGPYPVFPVGPYLVMFGMMLLYAVAYVAIAIGISASVASKSRAAAAGFGAYFALNVFPVLQSPESLVEKLHADILGLSEAPNLYAFAGNLVPDQALLLGVSAIDDLRVGPGVPTDAPFYLQPTVAPVILCLWIVVPLVVGYARFRAADLT